MCGLRLVPQLKWTALSRAERYSKWVHIGLHDVCLLHAARCVECHSYSTIQHDTARSRRRAFYERLMFRHWTTLQKSIMICNYRFIWTESIGLHMKMFTVGYEDVHPWLWSTPTTIGKFLSIARSEISNRNVVQQIGGDLLASDLVTRLK